MHVNRRRALGIVVPVLLVSATAVTAISLTARAQTYQDTALSASDLTVHTFAGTNLADATVTSDGNDVIDLSGTGVTWSLHGTAPTGVSVSATTSGDATISCSGCTVTSSVDLVAVATDSAGDAEALEITADILTPDSIEKVDSPVLDTVTGLAAANTAGTVTFSATSSGSNSITFAEANLPTGLTSGNPLTYSGGTAVPGTYGGVTISATDAEGAVQNGAFTLTVNGNTVITGNEGNYVNPFGNGFDAFRQHEYAGAIIAGWPATQADPATHFILNTGTHSGAYQIEYAPNGTASGLCVSDPGGGWSSDPLPDGLILANCNTGPWQQFIPQSDGTLINVATGLYVNPDGKGAQLRGESSATSWGGSSYTWTAYSSLP